MDGLLSKQHGLPTHLRHISLILHEFWFLKKNHVMQNSHKNPTLFNFMNSEFSHFCVHKVKIMDMGTTLVETSLAKIAPWFWRQISKTYIRQWIIYLEKKVIFPWLYLYEKSKWFYLFDHYDKRKRFLTNFNQFVKIYQHSRYICID